MAYFVAKQSGDFNTAGTWNRCSTADSTALENTSTTNFSGTPRSSQTFTAPDLVSQCLGAVFWAKIPLGWTGSFTLELLESGVVKATEVISYTAIRYPASEMTPLYIKFTTPYTYATLTASAYNFRITATATGATGAIGTVGTTPGMLAVDDRTGAPGTTDDVVIINEIRQSADLTVTASGTVQCGGNIRTSAPDMFGATPTTSLRYAVNIAYSGELKIDNTVATTFTCNGQMCVFDGGKLTCGTDASPITSANPALIEFSKAQPNGLFKHHGIVSIVGATKDVRRVYASGAGTAADPFIISAAASTWAVNDEIVVPEVDNGATNYSNTQYRFIKTVNSSTSFVVSATAGGAESAFTNDRVDTDGNSHVINLTRSVRIMGKSGTGANVPVVWFGGYLPNYGSTGYAVRHEFTVKYARFEDCSGVYYSTLGTNVTGSSTQYLASRTGNVYYAMTGTVTDYSFKVSPLDAFSFSEDTFVKCSTSINSFTLSGTLFTTFTSFNVVDCTRGGVYLNGGIGWVIDNWIIACQNKDGSSASTGQTMALFGASPLCIVKNCDIYSSRSTPIVNNSNTFAPEFSQCKFGVRGKLNDAFAVVSISGGAPITLTDCYFGEGYYTFTKSSLSTGSGTNLIVVNYGAVANDSLYVHNILNARYEPTGTGLSDTTVRTSGSKAMRIYAGNSTSNGGSALFQFYVIAEAGKTVNLFGYAKKAAALVGLTCRMRLTLPFAQTYAQQITLTDDTNWNLWTLSADYSAGTITSLARVDLIVPYAASGYLYLDDILNGTNVITALDLVHAARPAEIMSNTIGDPNAVWQVLQNSANTAGTFGAALQNAYQAKVWMADDNSGANDRYVVAWFKNGAPLTSGITSPTIQVVRADTGTDLVASTAMSALGSTGAFKYDTGLNRIVDGSAYIVIITAIIDGAVRTWMQPISRDS